MSVEAKGLADRGEIARAGGVGIPRRMFLEKSPQNVERERVNFFGAAKESANA
jgi:hypothetical protein